MRTQLNFNLADLKGLFLAENQRGMQGRAVWIEPAGAVYANIKNKKPPHWAAFQERLLPA